MCFPADRLGLFSGLSVYIHEKVTILLSTAFNPRRLFFRHRLGVFKEAYL